MEIFNINGATVESILAENISMESININVAGLAPGIYLLKAECDGNAPLYSRFVKE